MKINSLLQEGITAASSPENATNSAPKIGRSDKFLEDAKLEETSAGATGSGSVASVSSPVGGVQRRAKGSIFSGIKTSEKFPNSKAVKEAQLDEVNPQNFDSDEDYYDAVEADDLDLDKFGNGWDIPDEIAVLTNQLRRTQSPYLRQQIENKIKRYEDIYYGEDDLEEGSALNRVRDELGDQGYIGTQADRLRDRERHKEWMDKHHDISMHKLDKYKDADDAYHDSRVAYWNAKADQYKQGPVHGGLPGTGSDPMIDKAMNMFIDRMNRHQYKSQRDVDPEQLKKITDIKYKDEVDEGNAFLQQHGFSGKFPEPRKPRPDGIMSKSEVLGKDGLVYHWQDPRGRQDVGQVETTAQSGINGSAKCKVCGTAYSKHFRFDDQGKPVSSLLRHPTMISRDFPDLNTPVEEAKKANTKTARAEFGKRVKAKPSEKEQEQRKSESDAAWERLMAYADEQKKKAQGVAEESNPEYDDEAGSAESNLHTIARAAQGLIDTIGEDENLPEWAQEKIAKVEGMLVAVWDYLESQEAQGIDPQVDEDWQKTNKQDKTDGMSPKAVKAYRRENPGSKLKTAVTTKPSKLKPGSKDAKRRKSFCARMGGMKGPMKDEKGRPTAKAKALSRWNCESVEQTVKMLESVQRDLSEVKQRLDPKCWKGYKKQGTKMKGGVRVNNCVPVSEAEFNEDKLAQDLYKDLQIFKKGADKEIGPKAKDKEISSKAKDKEIIAKVTKK